MELLEELEDEDEFDPAEELELALLLLEEFELEFDDEFEAP